ncbi:hypothetical protein F1880_009579 [Penicillium rolfsii]|nr:hypothetical protein F1880_009579 [Penicillium rolfsii]
MAKPTLTPTEQKVIKDYGGWIEFLACYALSPKDEDDVVEGMAILKMLADEEENKENIIADVLREREI